MRTLEKTHLATHPHTTMPSKHTIIYKQQHQKTLPLSHQYDPSSISTIPSPTSNTLLTRLHTIAGFVHTHQTNPFPANINLPNDNANDLEKTCPILRTMSDQPPNLAELFTNLLNSTDANTRAAIFSVLQAHSPTNNLHIHSYVDDIAASIHDINSTTLVPVNNTPTPQTPLATNNTTNPTTLFATNNITTGSTTSTSNNLDYDDPEDNFILSQSEVAPRIHNTHSTNHIIFYLRDSSQPSWKTNALPIMTTYNSKHAE